MVDADHRVCQTCTLAAAVRNCQHYGACTAAGLPPVVRMVRGPSISVAASAGRMLENISLTTCTGKNGITSHR